MDRVEVNHMHICNSTMNEMLQYTETVIAQKQQTFAVFVEANLLGNSLNNPMLQQLIDRSDMACPDGTVTALAASFRSGKRVQRITGPAFMLKACEYGQKLNWKHYFYGGQPGVAEKLVERLKAAYPQMQVAGIYSPPFRKCKAGEPFMAMTAEEITAEAEMINAAQADLVWVGLGGPKQEYWINTFLHKINAPLLLGVGAAFDFHSGNRPWAPVWIRKIGMEWLYRMLSGGWSTFKRNLKCTSLTGMFLLMYFIKYRILRRPDNR